MSALGSLVVKLALEYAQYTGGLDKSEQATLASLKRIQGAADQFSTAVGDKLKTGVQNGLGALAAFFAAGSLAAQVKAVVDDLDRIADAAAGIGVTAQGLAELGYAAKLSGTDAQTLEGAMGKLNLKISEAVSGNKEAAKVFDALGVKLKDNQGNVRATDDVLGELANTFKDLPEGPTKSALAVELFGKTGAGLLQFLSQGSEGIQGLRNEFVALSGGPISDAAEMAGAFNDQLDKLAVLGQAATLRFGSELLPTLTEVARMFTDTGDDAMHLGEGMDVAAAAGAGLRTLLEMVLLLGSDVAYVLNGMGREIGGIVAQFNALGEGGGIFSAAGRKAWSDVGEAMRGDAEQARRKLEEFQRRVMAAPANANASGGSADDAREQRRNNEKSRTQQDAERRAQAALATEKKGAEAAADAYDKLLVSIRARLNLADQQLALGRELTEGEKFEAKAREDLAKMATQLSGGKVAAAQREIEVVKDRIEQVTIERQIEKELMAVAQDRARIRKADADSVAQWLQAQEEAAATTLQSIKERLDGLREEEAAASLARDQNISLAEAIERVAIARLREQQQGLYEEGTRWGEIEREIEAREKLLGLLSRKDLREREDRAWTDFFGSIDRTAHDTFVNVFEDGAGSFKRLGQTLKASVLDVLYQMTVRRWMINIGTSIFGGGFGAAAQAATGGAGVLSGIGSIGNGFSLLSGLGGAFGGGVAGGFGGLLGSLGLSGAGTTLGGALSAGGIALQSGNILGGLGTFAGALGPIALGIGALASLLGKDNSGTFHTGALSEYSAASGLANSTTHGAFGMGFGGVDFSAQTQAFTGGLARSISQLLDATASTFGKEGGYRVATAFADDTSEDGAWGGLLISRLEETLLNWDEDRTSRWAPRELANGEEGQKQFLTLVAGGVRDVIDQIGLPEWANSMLDELGDGASIEQLAAVVEQISNIKAVFEDFGQYMPTFASLADSAVAKLTKASGGAQALSANMSTFVANFFTEEERLAVATANVTAELAKLGFGMPATRDEFKAMLQAQWALGDAGADTAARLLALSGAVAAVTEATDAATTSAQALAAAERDRYEGLYAQLEKALAAERKGLQAQADLLGETTSTLQGLSSLLRDASRELIGSVDSGRSMLAEQGRAFISQALASARATGYLPDEGALSEAISAARAGMSADGAYASDFERRFDARLLGNELAALGGITDDQLSVAEQQLRGVNLLLEGQDKTLEHWRELIDLANGEIEAILTVSDAIAALTGALAPQSKPGKGGTAGGSVGGGFVIGGGGGGGGGGMSAEALAELRAQNIRDYVGSAYGGSTDFNNAKALADISAMAGLSGWSLEQISTALNVPAQDIVDMMAGAGLGHWRGQLPAFADGGFHAGGWALVGERGPELAYMPPAQIYTAQQSARMLAGPSGGSDSGVSQALQGIQTTLDDIRTGVSYVASNTSGLPQMVDQFDSVTSEGAFMRTLELEPIE